MVKEMNAETGDRSRGRITFLRVPYHGNVNKIRQVLRFLVDCLSPWIAMREMIPYSEAKRLITAVVFEDEAIVHKSRNARNELWNLLLDDE